MVVEDDLHLTHLDAALSSHIFRCGHGTDVLRQRSSGEECEIGLVVAMRCVAHGGDAFARKPQPQVSEVKLLLRCQPGA